MSSIGAVLRDARESTDTSIEEAAWRTRNRPDYLRALEDGRYDEVGDRSFVRGHLHSYARTLGLDAAAIIDEYEKEFSDEQTSPIRHLDKTVGVGRKPKRPRWLLAAVLTGAVLAGVSAVGLLHGPGERIKGEAALPALPSRHEASAASRGTVAAPKAPAPQAGPSRVAPGSEFAVGVVADKRCWVEVVSDGETVFAGILGPGQERSFAARKTLKITLGNAGAARVSFNGTPVTGGASGVWQATFGPSGLQA